MGMKERLTNKARSRGWNVADVTVKGVTLLVFTKDTDVVTVRLNLSGDAQSAKVNAKRVDHRVKSVTSASGVEVVESTIHNWLEW